MAKEIIVYTAGTFDLFHIGHLNILKKSKKLGSKLIVGVSTDDLVESYKKKAPIIPFEDRKEIINNIKIVDEIIDQHVLINPEDLKNNNIDIITIGDDWKDKTLPGLEWAKENNIQVVYLPYTESVSSTEIKRNIKNGWQEDVE